MDVALSRPERETLKAIYRLTAARHVLDTEAHTGDLADALGFASRHQAQEWLAQRGVPLSYTLDHLEQDRKNLDELLGRK